MAAFDAHEFQGFITKPSRRIPTHMRNRIKGAIKMEPSIMYAQGLGAVIRCDLRSYVQPARLACTRTLLEIFDEKAGEDVQADRVRGRAWTRIVVRKSR